MLPKLICYTETLYSNYSQLDLHIYEISDSSSIWW